MAYAENTNVSVEKSRGEIENTLARYGADQFSYARDDSRGMAMIEFVCHERRVRFLLRLPNRDEKRFQLTPSKHKRRTPQQAYAAWEQGCRQRWRALALCIKAKLEAVQSEISEFEEEFLSNIVLPDGTTRGTTAGEWLRPQIAHAYATGEMPAELLALPAPE